MTSDEPRIDKLLASALRGESIAWPGAEKHALVINQILYHGISGLLAGRVQHLADWPREVLESVREQAIAQAMWELRHRALLSELLAAFTRDGIVALLLKGTAVAYDLYPTPAARSRGDSDLLIDLRDVDGARLAFEALGYHRQAIDDSLTNDFCLQEVWSLECGGTVHHVDLHWQLMNAPALRDVLSFAECAANPMALPRLAPEARSMDRVLTLIHTCVHRLMHVTAPYFVDGVTYYGGDRLIWANDIHLLAGALSEAEWARLSALALGKGVAAVCLDGLTTARHSLGTEIPNWVGEELGSELSEGKASTYLLHSRQFARARQDLLATPGLRRKFAYLRARSLPSPAFIRGKYPSMVNMPLALLYFRRLVDLLRARPRRNEGR